MPKKPSPGAAATTHGARTNFSTPLHTSNSSLQQVVGDYPFGAPKLACGELRTLFEETFPLAPLGLKERLYRHITPTLAGECLVHLARVRFETYRFDFDAAGQWAVVAPIIECGRIADFGAFAADNDEARQVFGLGHFAVGLEDATFDMRLHRKNLLLMHFSVWRWLGCECTGLLPIRWKQTALHVKKEGCGLLFDNHIEERKAEARLRQALSLPPIFVREELDAA